MDFNTLKRNLNKDFSRFKKVKIALLGDSATQMLNKAIKGYGFEEEINFEIYEADYDQINQEIFNNKSELYLFEPEFTFIFFSTQKMLSKFYKDKTDQLAFADNFISNLNTICQVLNQSLNTKIIISNYVELDNRLLGNYSNKVETSFLFQLRKINFELMLLGQNQKNTFINDLSYLQSLHGNNFLFDEKFYYSSDLVFSLDFYAVIAKNVTQIISSILGSFKKCLILDLDNTIWGGIIGDDGIEKIQIGDLGIGKIFTEFQNWAKQLQKRGIILCICSKNTEEVAKEPFEKHPDMVLRLEDISVFVANWNNKADNIRYIQEVLNIGFDSMVFLDDNPMERSIVRGNIPNITVPELPDDPALYLSYLNRLNLFEIASISENDQKRTLQYQIEAKRKIEMKNYTNEEDFLKSLSMFSSIDTFNNFNIPRVSQLSQRSNQFNLRTIRYTEEELKKIAASDKHYTFAFSLEDKFGDNGIISIIILKGINQKSVFIDTWIMSCRVLKRGMENFVLNKIVEFSRARNFQKIIGERIPTKKNKLVENHYQDLGFILRNNFWELEVSNYQNKLTYVEAKTTAINI